MNIDLKSLIDKALYYYDIKSIEYKNFIDSDNIIIGKENQTISFPDVDIKALYNYEVLGIFDNTTNIWMWGWMIPDFTYNETETVKKLLNYGLKITPSLSEGISPDRLYLKTQLVNSRFLLEDDFQLELHLAISCYLCKDNIKFVYYKRKYLSENKQRYITIYYLIK